MPTRFAILAAAAIALSGCGASSVSSPAATSTVSATSGPSAAPTTASAMPGASAAGGGTVAVDLTFTGTYPLTANGSAGQCSRGTSSTGAPLLSFSASGTDYPGLGTIFNLTEAPDGKVSVKWLATSSLFWASVVTGVTYSADHRTMNVDFAFPGISNPEHVKGAVYCP
jgi:hypothetical protein